MGELATDATIVVPCYNEERRLDASGMAQLCGLSDVRVLFVDDGSSDGTAGVLRRICRRADGRAAVLSLERNRGKAEAVRRGLVRALDEGASLAGFLDADLSTPVCEMERLLGWARGGQAHVVMGVRSRADGGLIHRRPVRRIMGAGYLTVARLVVGRRFADLQCGAKVFASTPLLREVLEEPFISRWAFDTELMGRLLAGTPGQDGLPDHRIAEVPLNRWVEVEGSKLGALDVARTAADLAVISADLRARRRRASGRGAGTKRGAEPPPRPPAPGSPGP